MALTNLSISINKMLRNILNEGSGDNADSRPYECCPELRHVTLESFEIELCLKL
jgi:hypothetical protein